MRGRSNRIWGYRASSVSSFSFMFKQIRQLSDWELFIYESTYLESTEESLLGTEDLNGRSRVFRERHEGSGVGDQTSTNEFSDEGGQVGSDRGHAVAEVFVEFGAVLSDRDDLVTEEVDVVEILFRDLSSHRDGGGRLERLFELFGEDVGEVGSVVVRAESHRFDDLGVGYVFGNNLAHLGEVPSVPFL